MHLTAAYRVIYADLGWLNRGYHEHSNKAHSWVPGMQPTATVAAEVPRLHQGPSAFDMLLDTTIGMLPDSLAVARDIVTQLSLPDLIQQNRRLEEALLDKMRRVRQVWLVHCLRRNHGCLARGW